MLSADPWDWLFAGAAALGWAGVTWRCLRPHRPVPGGDGGELLILWASQSGTAAAQAGQIAKLLHDQHPVVLPLDQLEAKRLQTARRAVFVIATSGEGEAPDHARGALERLKRTAPDLRHLSYAMLAAGDRSYAQFCGYGRQVERFLQDQGAREMLPRAEMDRGDPEVLADFLQRLGEGFGQPRLIGEEVPRWRLISRRRLNPGSPGGGLYALRFQPEAALPDWQAGDIASLTLPGSNGLIRRDYSLASLPQSGSAELVLRHVIDAQGRPGQGSHYLTQEMQPGESLPLQLRANPGFRAKDHAAPMILIGNGSGMAGLLSHLRARASREGGGPCALFFGERSPLHDEIFAEELKALRTAGLSLEVHRAFSRSAQPRYVQDLLQDHSEPLRAAVRSGAHIYLCGRREGMAEAVLACLREVFGDALWQRLREESRLHQDVY